MCGRYSKAVLAQDTTAGAVMQPVFSPALRPLLLEAPQSLSLWADARRWARRRGRGLVCGRREWGGSHLRRSGLVWVGPRPRCAGARSLRGAAQPQGVGGAAQRGGGASVLGRPATSTPGRALHRGAPLSVLLRCSSPLSRVSPCLPRLGRPLTDSSPLLNAPANCCRSNCARVDSGGSCRQWNKDNAH